MRKFIYAGIAAIIVFALTVVLAPSASANVPSLFNATAGGIGVIHHQDGGYTVPGKYDTVLGGYKETNETPINWSSVAGAYNGSSSKRICIRSTAPTFPNYSFVINWKDGAGQIWLPSQWDQNNNYSVYVVNIYTSCS